MTSGHQNNAVSGEKGKQHHRFRSKILQTARQIGTTCSVQGFSKTSRRLLRFSLVTLLHKDVDTLEKVRIRVIKLVSGLRNLSYEERLLNLGRQPLEERKAWYDFMLALKIITERDQSDQRDQFFQLRGNGRTRGHEFKLRKTSSTRKTLDVSKHFFSQRVVHSWNALPSEISATFAYTFLNKNRSFLRKYVSSRKHFTTYVWNPPDLCRT